MTSQFKYIHDLPATEDELGRTDFANSLSGSLVLPMGSPGLVVGIEGNWGSGKSTLIGLIKENLEKMTGGRRPIIVDFNPWIISNTGSQVEALIGQIAASIGKDLSLGENRVKTGEKLLSYVGLISNLRFLKFIPSLGWLGNVAEEAVNLLQNSGEFAVQSAKVGKEALGEVNKLLPALDLSQKRDEVIEALSELDRPLIVIIDDLDRLPEEEIRSMVQVIKAVADFPQITYLLAYDRNIVAPALGRDIKDGLSYLEKIVQVAYPIPPLSQLKLKRFADTKIKTLLQNLDINLCAFESNRYEDALVLVTKLARHPRDIIRVINRLTLSLPATHREVNVADVIVFEALSQRFPALREAIHSHPKDFIGSNFREDLIDEDTWEDFAETIDKGNKELPLIKHLSKDDAEDQRISKAACDFLFPVKEEGDERFNYEDHLRIADPDRLARLFRMTSLEDVPEAKEIHAMLSNPERLKEALTLAKDEDERLTLLDWLVSYLPSCESPNVQGCIEKIIVVYRNLVKKELTDRVVIKYAQLIIKLLRLKKPGYVESFMSIVKNAPLSLAEKIMLRAADDQGKWAIRPMSANISKQLIPDSGQVDEAIAIWTQRVYESSHQGNFHEEANFISILCRYKDFKSDTEFFELIERMCEMKDGLVAFLKFFKYDDFLNEKLKLVGNPKKLASIISDYKDLKSSYQWLIDILEKQPSVVRSSSATA